jgi:hypothetical protein
VANDPANDPATRMIIRRLTLAGGRHWVGFIV